MADPYYANVALLLPMNGADGSTSFIDYSPTPKTITVYGNAKISTAQSKFGGASAAFDGSGDYLGGGSGWLSAGQFGTGSFTVECWVYVTGAPNNNQVIWSANAYPNTTGLYLKYENGNATGLRVSTGSIGLISASAGWSYNAWHHVAVVRSGTTLYLFIDGVNRGSTTWSNNCSDGLQFIGRPSDAASYMLQGYLDELRITPGVARYTADFTPPDTLLSPISGTILDTNGTPCARTVHLFDRASGTKLDTTVSDASTGQYAVYAPSSGNEVIRVVLADEPSLYNDIIDRVIPG